MSQNELKPCPFCGDCKNLRYVKEFGYPHIYCLMCFALGPPGKTGIDCEYKEEAEIAWNKRYEQ